MNEILLLALVAGVSGVCGAVAGVAAYFGGTRGERSRFEGELAPLRASIAEVADRFDHWTKRERRRDAVGGPKGPDQVQGEGQGSTRHDRLREVARRFQGR